MGPKEAWELITTLLKLAKRLETVLVLVGTGAWYVLTDLYTTESLFGRESRVLLVIAGLLAILALAISLKERHADAWKPFIAAAILSAAGAMWLGASAPCYAYAAVLLLGSAVLYLTRGTTHAIPSDNDGDAD